MKVLNSWGEPFTPPLPTRTHHLPSLFTPIQFSNWGIHISHNPLGLLGRITATNDVQILSPVTRLAFPSLNATSWQQVA